MEVSLKEETLSSLRIYEGHTINLRVDTVKMPSGQESIREVVEHRECVAVVPIDNEGNVLLVNQFRYALGKELLEIPAGGIDPGEGPEEAVRRELQEETGYLPKKLKRLGGFYSTPGFCNEYLHLFLATELVPSQLYAEDTEGIKVVRVPVGQVRRLIASDEICDAKSVAGLCAYLESQAG
ncbi:MAG: NUDIX hydrolase [Chloroflexi bacterium]|nr:NUDIX hydrolase [Chloroflexota bacterium]